jgi:hypothetical protein
VVALSPGDHAEARRERLHAGRCDAVVAGLVIDLHGVHAGRCRTRPTRTDHRTAPSAGSPPGMSARQPFGDHLGFGAGAVVAAGVDERRCPVGGPVEGAAGAGGAAGARDGGGGAAPVRRGVPEELVQVRAERLARGDDRVRVVQVGQAAVHPERADVGDQRARHRGPDQLGERTRPTRQRVVPCRPHPLAGDRDEDGQRGEDAGDGAAHQPGPTAQVFAAIFCAVHQVCCPCVPVQSAGLSDGRFGVG